MGIVNICNIFRKYDKKLSKVLLLDILELSISFSFKNIFYKWFFNILLCLSFMCNTLFISFIILQESPQFTCSIAKI